MAEELWVEGAGGKRGAEGPAGWQRVGWTEVVQAEWVVWAKRWAGQRGGIAVEGVWGVRHRGLCGVGAVGRGSWLEERAGGQRGPNGQRGRWVEEAI